MHSAITNGAAKSPAISSRIARERARERIWARVIDSEAIGSAVTGIGTSGVLVVGFAARDGDRCDQQADGHREPLHSVTAMLLGRQCSGHHIEVARIAKLVLRIETQHAWRESIRKRERF